MMRIPASSAMTRRAAHVLLLWLFGCSAIGVYSGTVFSHRTRQISMPQSTEVPDDPEYVNPVGPTGPTGEDGVFSSSSVEDIEGVTNDEDIGTTSSYGEPFSSILANKTGRNFGTRLRGLNTANNNNANTVVTVGGVGGGSKGQSAVPLQRPRPTSSVISYNSNYNRVVKRRKIPAYGTTGNGTSHTSVNSVVAEQDSTLSYNQTDESSHIPNPTAPTIRTRTKQRPKPLVVSDSISGLNSTSVEHPFGAVASSDIPIVPSLPYKIRRVKITSRRPVGGFHSGVNSAESVDSEDSVPYIRSVSSATSAKALEVSSPDTVVITSTNENPMAQIVPSSTVKDGVFRYTFSEAPGGFTELISKRVNDSGSSNVNKDSYENDPIETTTETYLSRYSAESSTDIPSGTFIEGSMAEDNVDPTTYPSNYREFTSTGDKLTLGRDGANIKDGKAGAGVETADERGVSSVTVTVTRTVIHTAATGASKSSSTIRPEDLSRHASVYDFNQYYGTASSPAGDEDDHAHEEDDGQYHHQRYGELVHATPALPSIPSKSVEFYDNAHQVVSSQSFNRSKESVVLKSQAFSNNTFGINIDQVEDHQHDHSPEEHDHNLTKKQDTDNVYDSQGNFHVTTSSPPYIPISTSADLGRESTSLFYTKVQNPYFSSSSYSYTSTSAYSYGVKSHEERPEHNNSSQIEPDNTHKPQEIHPTTSSFWDNLGMKSSFGMPVGPGNHTSTPTSVFVSNSSSSSNEQDQDVGFSTPEVDTEAPPVGTGSHEGVGSGSHEEATTVAPGNDAENEISEEEGKTQNGGSADSADGHRGPNIDSDGNPQNNNGNKVNEKSPTKVTNPSSAAGAVSFLPPVPIVVKMLLDMSRTVFCSHESLFKEMIVTVYADKNNVDSDQIIVFSVPNCINPNSTTSSAEGSTSSVEEPEGQFDKDANEYLPFDFVKSQSSEVIHLNTTERTKTVEIRERKVRSTILDTNVGSKGEAKVNESKSDAVTTSKETDEKFTNTSGLPVYFYVNNKNGSYDRELTVSFVQLWNDERANGSMFYRRVKKVDMVESSGLVSEHRPSNENSGIIAAITIASIAAACLLLLGVLLLVMRHRQAATKFAKRCTPVTLDDYSLDNISVYTSFRRKQRLRGSKRSYTNAAFDDPNAPTRPVNAAGLASVVTDASGLEEEFRAIPNQNPTLDDIPSGAETKNRYANVIPMPDTRVLLTFQDDTPNSDYINANFVRGAAPAVEPKRYIITQGPLDDTVVDFWRMVWEQQTRVIFMLTDFSESGIPKCSEYYPRSETIDCSQLHGDYQVTLEKRDISENCITSYLVIKDMERNLRRDVIHLWYHSWPEKGVPASAKVTVDFLLKARKFTKEPYPILVHCSPGTGRSGTIVACDIAMKEYEAQHKVDIPRTVMKIRQNRAGAVQTKEQYIHIYEVVHYYANRISGSQPDSI